MKKWLKKWTPSIIFNVGELAAIFLTGMWLLKSWEFPLYVMAAFIFSRQAIGKPKHYKAWQLCLVWSYVVFLSMFILARASLPISLILSAFSALVLTDRFRLNDTFMLAWKNKDAPSKHQKLIDLCYRNYHEQSRPDQSVIDFEEYLKRHKDERMHKVFRMRLVAQMTYAEVAELLNIETARVSELCDKILIEYVSRNVIF